MLKRLFSGCYLIAFLVFLYLPVVIMMAMSFNKSQYNALPFEFSTKWYYVMAENNRLIEATIDSIFLAIVTGAICVVLATALMLGQQEFNQKIKKMISSLFILPLIIPWIVLGLALLLLLRALGLDRNYFMVVAGHIVVSFPYAAMVIGARLHDMNKEIQEASANLGANEWTTFKRITLPMLFPAIIAGGFLAFMISFDNFVMSYFLIPSGQSTLPIEIYSSIKFGFTPEINAISTIILCVSIIIIALIAGLMKSSLLKIFK